MIYEMVQKLIEELKQYKPYLSVSAVEHNDGALVEIGQFYYDIIDVAGDSEVTYEVAQVQLMLPKPGVAGFEIIAHFIELDGSGELSGGCWGSYAIDVCNAHSLLEHVIASVKDSSQRVSFKLGEANRFNQNSSDILNALLCTEVRELYSPSEVA
jgi:hypothetical protein